MCIKSIILNAHQFKLVQNTKWFDPNCDEAAQKSVMQRCFDEKAQNWTRFYWLTISSDLSICMNENKNYTFWYDWIDFWIDVENIKLDLFVRLNLNEGEKLECFF